MLDLTGTQWLLLAVGAFVTGLSQGGIAGVAIYRKHADWRYVWRLCPWVVAGARLAVGLTHRALGPTGHSLFGPGPCRGGGGWRFVEHVGRRQD